MSLAPSGDGVAIAMADGSTMQARQVIVAAGAWVTDLLGDRAVGTIGGYAKSGQPFLLSLHFNAPHWPWEGPDDEATPNGARDKKAAALNEEAKETKAAAEAEENSDNAATTANTGDANSNVNGAPPTEKSKVKATSMPIENKPKAPAKAPAKTDAKDTNDGRPRRIQPNQQ